MEHEPVYPRLKSCYFVMPHRNVIQIGVVDGHAVEIDNASGIAEYCLALCDGRFTREEICEKVVQKFPDQSKTEIENSLNYLYSEGILENACTENKSQEKLSRKSRERYSRQISFFNLFTKKHSSPYDYQKKIAETKIALIGLGGGGNNLSQAFASMGVGKIRGIDFDQIDISNLNRQILFRPNDVGQYKADVIRKRISEINPDVEFEPVRERIDSVSKARKYIRGFDIVICTADGPVYDIYRITDEACVKENLPWISFGVVETMSIVGPFVVPSKTATYNEYIAKQKVKYPDYLELVDTIRSNEHEIRKKLCPPSFLPMFTFCCSLISSEVIKWITGFAKPTLYNTILRYYIKTGKIEKEKIR